MSHSSQYIAFFSSWSLHGRSETNIWENVSILEHPYIDIPVQMVHYHHRTPLAVAWFLLSCPTWVREINYALQKTEFFVNLMYLIFRPKACSTFRMPTVCQAVLGRSAISKHITDYVCRAITCVLMKAYLFVSLRCLPYIHDNSMNPTVANNVFFWIETCLINKLATSFTGIFTTNEIISLLLIIV